MVEGKARANPSHIEGGVDAVVIGASPDGLVAAAYLGRAGLKTVLLESGSELGLPLKTRDETSCRHTVDGEHLLHALDAQVIEDLDLYRHGVEYWARRLDTLYYFSDGESLRIGGDLGGRRHEVEEDSENLERFLSETLEAAMFLRPLFAGAPGAVGDFKTKALAQSADFANRLERMMTVSADDMLAHYFSEGRIYAAMMAEAGFRSGAAPQEAMSFSALLARWSGEIAGLQGAVAFAAGGVGAVVEALRRSAQKANVDIRASSPIASILIEKDRAAGIAFDDGRQVRAPIVISAADAETTFMKRIGPSMLGGAFQRAVAMGRSPVASAHLRIAAPGAALDETTRDNLSARLVRAPAPHDLRRAFAKAAAGETPEAGELILEAVFVHALAEDGDGDRLLASMIAHPLPHIAAPTKSQRKKIRDVVISALEDIAPDIGLYVDNERLVLSCDLAKNSGASPHVFAAKPGVVRQLALAAAAASADHIAGLYFCGPEAQIGYGVNGAAGRIAAQAALHKIARAGAAP